MIITPEPTEYEKQLAKKLVLKMQQLLPANHPDFTEGMIHSIRTANNYMQDIAQYFAWRRLNKLAANQRDNRNQAIIYLDERSEIYQQSTLNQHRLALKKVFDFKLPPVESQLITLYLSRDYSEEEVNLITSHQDPHNAISTLIAFFSGLRAHEFATLRPFDEMHRSSHRTWDENLFLGMPPYIIFTVQGKGGLKRWVAIPILIAEFLEQFRLPEPIRIRDRGIFYEQYYDIGYGQSLSQSFSDASFKYLGFSNGFHGLRHTYCKWRFRTLKELVEPDEAKLIVSQELGHFRPQITSCYRR